MKGQKFKLRHSVQYNGKYGKDIIYEGDIVTVIKKIDSYLICEYDYIKDAKIPNSFLRPVLKIIDGDGIGNKIPRGNLRLVS